MVDESRIASTKSSSSETRPEEAITPRSGYGTQAPDPPAALAESLNTSAKLARYTLEEKRGFAS
jgi:hypothetical protein